MVEKKLALVATLVAFTLVGTPLVASAAPVGSVMASGIISIHTEDEDDEDEDEDDEDEDEDEDEDDDHHGSIPPVFVVPGAKKPHHDRPRKPFRSTSGSTTATTKSLSPIELSSTGAIGTAAIDPATGEEFIVVGAGEDPSTSSLGGVNPKEAHAVDIKRVPVGIRNPAEQFMDTAYIGMGMLGVAALGLGVTAGVRAIRLRRSGKADYFYDDK